MILITLLLPVARQSPAYLVLYATAIKTGWRVVAKQRTAPVIEKAHFNRVMILKVVVAFCVCFQYPLLILTQSLKNFIVNKNLYIEVI